MTPVEYELGREYRVERQREAQTHRLARQAAGTRDSQGMSNRATGFVARELWVWIGGVVGLSRRSCSTLADRRIWFGPWLPTWFGPSGERRL